MLTHIGVFLIAISFAIFAVALSKLLYRTSTSLEAARKAAVMLESEMDETILAVEGTLMETNRTITDMEGKVNSLESVFLSVEKVGNAANVMGEKLDELTGIYERTERSLGTKPFIRSIQYAEFAKGIWKSWKRGQSLTAK